MKLWTSAKVERKCVYAIVPHVEKWLSFYVKEAVLCGTPARNLVVGVAYGIPPYWVCDEHVKQVKDPSKWFMVEMKNGKK